MVNLDKCGVFDKATEGLFGCLLVGAFHRLEILHALVIDGETFEIDDADEGGLGLPDLSLF